MNNNPFRKEPNQTSVENWGKTKFKPKKFDKSNNKFGKNQNNNGSKNKFGGKNRNTKGNTHNKEKYKFNVVAKDARPDNATPWNKYKDEIVFKQREEEQAALQADMNSSEAKEILKQREINYRKLLIEQKKQEPTQWEDFAEEDENVKTENKKKNKNKLNSFGQLKYNKRNKNSHEQKLNSNSKTDFKPKSTKVLFPTEKLDNIDNKQLNFDQNNMLRATITKNTIIAKGGGSLENTVKNLKRKMMRKKNAKNKS